MKMKKNVLIAVSVVGLMVLTGITVCAGSFIKKSVECPNCGTLIELEEKNMGRGRGRYELPKTVEEYKQQLSEFVAEGKMTQEQMDKKIAQYEERQKKAEERKDEREKKLEELKANLAEKVATGEITQEQMEKRIEMIGKRSMGRNKRNGFGK